MAVTVSAETWNDPNPSVSPIRVQVAQPVEARLYWALWPGYRPEVRMTRGPGFGTASRTLGSYTWLAIWPSGRSSPQAPAMGDVPARAAMSLPARSRPNGGAAPQTDISIA